jgi:hypothetical protein
MTTKATSKSAFTRALVACAIAASCLFVATGARAAHKAPGTAAESVRGAMDSGQHAFCKDPPKDLEKSEAWRLCPLAKEQPDCAPLAAACDHVKKEAPSPKSDGPKIAPVLGQIAYAFTIGICALAVAMLLGLIAIALLRARRDRALADADDRTDQKKTAAAPERVAFSITDAERLLALASEHARRGEIKEALGTYLTACLRALDQRGFIRFARHRTNGEYVRSCSDGAARAELATVVREVEAAEFGGNVPSQEAVARVARSATALVRGIALASLAVLLVLTSGCDGAGMGSKKPENDPAGMQLFIDVARRQGLEADYLGGSLGALPLPAEDDVAPLVVVDLARTTLDGEARAHLDEWARAGGVLLALAPTKDSVSLVHARRVVASSREVTIGLRDPYAGNLLEYPATLAQPYELELDTADGDAAKEKDKAPQHAPPLVFGTVDPTGIFATAEPVGAGAIVTVASADLFTNVGMVRENNAEAVMAIVENAFSATRGGEIDTHTYRERTIRVARPEDGFTHPQDPITAMSHAGLGLGMWHALAAAIILFLAAGIRLSRPVPAAPPARRAFAEHVEATGALYARARSATHARTVFARFVDERVRSRAGQKGAALDDEAVARATGVKAETYKDLVASDGAGLPEASEIDRLRKLRRVLVAALSHEPDTRRTHSTSRSEKEPS